MRVDVDERRPGIDASKNRLRILSQDLLVREGLSKPPRLLPPRRERERPPCLTLAIELERDVHVDMIETRRLIRHIDETVPPGKKDEGLRPLVVSAQGANVEVLRRRVEKARLRETRLHGKVGDSVIELLRRNRHANAA